MNPSPVLALAALAAIGLLASRLPRLRWQRPKRFDLVLTAGGPLVLLGLALGPGIEFLTRPVLRALAPVTALVIGWIGAVLGARFEWRYVRRIPRGAWQLAGLSAAAAAATVALGAWLLARLLPALGAAWAPRLPAVLTLAAVASVSGPGAARLAAQAVGMRKSVARTLALAAALETACGALLVTIPFALHRARPPAGSPELGWFLWIVFAVGAGALVGIVFLALARLHPAGEERGFGLLATLLFGAGIGYAADLSPFVVCALAAALIVNASPRRHAVQRVLTDWDPGISAIFLVLAGALLTLPTAWILVAVPLLGLLRAAGKWAGARYGRLALGLTELPPRVGLATLAQGGAAVAVGLNFFLMYGGRTGSDAGGAVLTTIVLGVALSRLAAPRCLGLAFRPGRLTPAGASPELNPNAPAG